MKVVSRKTLTLPQKSGCKICSKKTAPITRSSRSSRRAQVRWRLHACYTKPHASQTKYQRVPQVTPSVGSCVSPSCHGRTKLCATILHVSSCFICGVSICLNRSFVKGGLKFQIWIFMPLLNRSGQRMLCQTWKQWRKGALLLQSITWSPSHSSLKSFPWSRPVGSRFRIYIKASRSAMPRELPLYTIYSQPGQCRSASCEIKSSLPQKKR